MPQFQRISHPLLVLTLFTLALLSSDKAWARDKVDEQLARKVSFKFVDMALEEVIYEIVGDVILYIDRDSFAEEGIANDEPVNKTFENVPAKQALDEITEPLGLQWSKTAGNEIKVTTKVASDRDEVRFYDVVDLLDSNQTSASQFLSSMLKSLQGRFREKDGGGATVLLRNGLLTVWQSPGGHEEVAEYLKALRTVKNLPAAETDPTPIYKSLLLDQKSRSAFLALQTHVSLDYEIAPIETHLAKILKQAKLEYQVAEPDEEQAKETSDHLIQNCPFRITDAPAITALERLLIDRGLSFTLYEGKLNISDEGNDPDHQLLVKMDEDSGWDAHSVADIVQDAVDKGEWQVIDGEGGTITQPLKDVLVIQNDVPALCGVLTVLDQLKRRPKSERAEASKREYSAGMGRKAPDNDWHNLEDHDKIVVRLQADLLPEIDEVVCYRLKFPSKEDSGRIWQFSRGGSGGWGPPAKRESTEQFQEKLHPFGVEEQVQIKGKEAAEIADLWRQLSFEQGAVPLLGIHLPEVGLEFRKQGRVVFQTTVSWTTGTTLFKFASGKYEMYGAALDKPPGRQLKDRLIRHQIFLQTYREMWHAQHAESREASPQN